MYYLIISFVVFSLLSSSALGQSRSTKRPPKATTVKGDSNAPPAAIPTLGATVEKYVSNYDINADGTAKESLELQKRCTTDVCVEQFKSFKLPFNGDLQKIKVADAYLVKPNGSQVKVPAEAIFNRPTAQAEAAPGFTSMREIEIKFNDWKPGDASYFRLESETIRPTFDGRYDAIELYALIFDWKSIEVNVTAPADRPIFTEAVGLDGGRLPDLNGKARWQYKKQDIKRIEIEPVMYDVYGVSPRFALTTFRDANELGAAFWEEVRKKAIVTPEIKTLADDITKGVSDPGQQAAAIYDWVNRNIRYLSIVLDRGGWIPHSSTEIINNRYGDCKDYTVIIHTLLKAKGIDSTPVLIRSDFGEWFPSVATAEYFNHAILYIPSLNLFADATLPNTRLGLIPQTLVGKKAVLAGEKTGIVVVPKDNPADNQIVSDVTYSFAPNGAVKARTRNTYVGRSEMVFRPLFSAEMTGRDATTMIRIMLAFFGVEGDGRIISVGNPHLVGEPFRVEMEVGVENYTTFSPKGKLALPIGLNMISMGQMEQFGTAETRKTSIAVGATMLRENIALELPPLVTVASLPAAVSFSNTAGTFKITPELKDGRVHIVRELTIAQDQIEPKDYPPFRALIKKVVESHNVEIDYTADPSLLKAKSKELRANAGQKKSTASLEERLLESYGFGGLDEKKLSARDVRSLEAKVAADPGNADARKSLIRHYANRETKQTGAIEIAHLQHRLWLIKNRPDISDREVYGYLGSGLEDAGKKVVRDAWLAKVESQKNNFAIRINAVNALHEDFPDVAEKLLTDGMAVDPTNYQFPLQITEFRELDMLSRATPEKKAEAAKKIFELGTQTLRLIKLERSHERDSDRDALLRRLCFAAVEIGELDAAMSFAQELILDFGQDVKHGSFDDVAHIGNITRGRVELRRNNIEKAKEHLLIAIRAPLRKENSSLLRVDFKLAEELLAKGEKQVVLEYLTLCLELGSYKSSPDLYDDEIKALDWWRTQINNGAKPSFDFTNPGEVKKP